MVIYNETNSPLSKNERTHFRSSVCEPEKGWGRIEPEKSVVVVVFKADQDVRSLLKNSSLNTQKEQK